MKKTGNENQIIIDSEKLFALAIEKYLNENKAKWTIIKSEFMYCYLDFVLINLYNLYTVYVEYKERAYKFGHTQYDSYFISLAKYNAIKKHYTNTYIVWDFTHQTKNDDEFYYIRYNEALFKTFEKDDVKHSLAKVAMTFKNRLLIPSKFCNIGFDNLMTNLIDIIPRNNLN